VEAQQPETNSRTSSIHRVIYETLFSGTTIYFQGGIGGARTSANLEFELPLVPQVDVGIGWRLGSHIVLGANIQAMVIPGKWKTEYHDSEFPEDNYTDEDNVLLGGFGFVPYLEMTSSNQKRVMPFFLVFAGIRNSLLSYKSEGDNYIYKYTVNAPHLDAGLGGGMHLFIVPRCSVDLSLKANLQIGKIKWKDEETGMDSYTEEDSIDSLRIAIDAYLGISAWI
ncbi:MAG: hypothetical protein JXX29_16945, partial [Deltaproteobacteria bacterium]|nr:hypothetical protein [Deltaproteobacteria bacterium]MBN2673374.1 hypothetical protein [Deltaproteobacteria bacterium]